MATAVMLYRAPLGDAVHFRDSFMLDAGALPPARADVRLNSVRINDALRTIENLYGVQIIWSESDFDDFLRERQVSINLENASIERTLQALAQQFPNHELDDPIFMRDGRCIIGRFVNNPEFVRVFDVSRLIDDPIYRNPPIFHPDPKRGRVMDGPGRTIDILNALAQRRNTWLPNHPNDLLPADYIRIGWSTIVWENWSQSTASSVGKLLFVRGTLRDMDDIQGFLNDLLNQRHTAATSKDR